jgi:hypothetical protein
LNFLRKDFVKDFEHLLPKLNLVVLEIHRYILLFSFCDTRVQWALKEHIGSTIAGFTCINDNGALYDLKLFRVKKIENRTRIVDRRVRELICHVVHLLVLL